jgi:hypothetical protein
MVTSVLVGLYAVVMGTVFVRRGLASWRHQVSFARRLRAGPLAAAERAGLERAFLVGGVFHYFLAALMAVTAYTSVAATTVGAAILMLVVLAGVVISGWLIITISLFNRPRFLVPPHLRGQPEALSRRADREDWYPARAGEQPPVGKQAAGPRRNGGPAIVVERDGDARRDKYRRYKIMVDGRRVGSIRAGGRREIAVPPAPHVVQLRIDWCSSPELRVDLAAGQWLVLRCGPDLTMEDKLGAVTVARNQYIRLELAGPT